MSTTTTAQSLSALERANVVRFARAEICREMFERPTTAESRERAAELLLDVPPELETMEVGDFLLRIRRFGTRASEKMLVGLGLQSNKPLGGEVRWGHPSPLTARQRTLLAQRLRGERRT